ncbi:hypothetical protein [Streptomyces ortus]|uniref:CDP-alcohol phosphatidyltransferase family protein n=1 Tax=Streptomyces ortus TaxID=2867268 RepID=A0ABT3V1Q2_9ACTN|nr:hypothetical protein [Streptomyces ortus]MCX4233511.1 hypothetical protein [Streptomyces ortus]
MAKKSAAHIAESSGAKSVRGRLMARVAGACAIGVQFLPDTEKLHDGLQLAAVMLLAADVLIDFLGGLYAMVRRVGEFVRAARAIWRQEADGSVVVGVRVRRVAVRSRVVLRFTGRVVSSLLVFFAGASQEWHTVLLAVALVVVVLDLVAEVVMVAGEAVRRRLG